MSIPIFTPSTPAYTTAFGSLNYNLCGPPSVAQLDWEPGQFQGSVTLLHSTYFVHVPSPSGPPHTLVTSNCDEAEFELLNYNTDHKLTVNDYRYLDQYTIEIKIGDPFTAKIDACDFARVRTCVWRWDCDALAVRGVHIQTGIDYFLHRFLFGNSCSEIVFRDGNPFNHRHTNMHFSDQMPTSARSTTKLKNISETLSRMCYVVSGIGIAYKRFKYNTHDPLSRENALCDAIRYRCENIKRRVRKSPKQVQTNTLLGMVRAAAEGANSSTSSAQTTPLVGSGMVPLGPSLLGLDPPTPTSASVRIAL
jgi:hypothetical protein